MNIGPLSEDYEPPEFDKELIERIEDELRADARLRWWDIALDALFDAWRYIVVAVAILMVVWFIDSVWMRQVKILEETNNRELPPGVEVFFIDNMKCLTYYSKSIYCYPVTTPSLGE